MLALVVLLGALGAGYATSRLRRPAESAPATKAPATAAPVTDAPLAAPVTEPRAMGPAVAAAISAPSAAVVAEPPMGARAAVAEPAWPAPPFAAPVTESPPPALVAEPITEACVIALSHAWGRGRFEVRVKDKGGAHRVVAQSLAFAVPRGMVLQESGAPGRAHRRLLLHLVAAGWRLEPPAGRPWYERRLTRPVGEPGDGDLDRALVAPRPEGGEAEFVALALDEYGNAQVMARSPRFGRRRGRPVEETEPAVAAHGTLLDGLAARGWRVSGTLDGWYGATLARRRR